MCITPKINYQDIIYYSAPKQGPKSLNEVDPEILKMFDKLGVPLQERETLAGVAVDAVIDSVSVGTTFKKKLGEMGVIFSSFSDAVHEHPELIEQYLGTVVPYNDNFFAALNSAGLYRWFLLLHPEGRPLPHGAFPLISVSTPPRRDSSSAHS